MNLTKVVSAQPPPTVRILQTSPNRQVKARSSGLSGAVSVWDFAVPKNDISEPAQARHVGDGLSSAS